MSAAPDSGGTFRLLICALGGEGGGVLMNWVVAAAREAGHAVQATSVPGVAQRTGSTTYYVETTPPRGPGAEPVLGLVPMPGRVDVVLASELVEAARVIEAGFVSPQLTTLIASSSRVHTTAEKIQLGDGRFDPDTVRRTAQTMARACHLLDLEALASAHGTFISATLFGALAGSGALPWPAAVSRAVLGDGRDAAANLAGFDAAREAIAGATGDSVPAPAAGTAPAVPGPAANLELGGVPPALGAVIAQGFERVVDFQDRAYGDLYLARCAALREAAGAGTPEEEHALDEACRRLALWMAYEDVARVADLKTRPERFARIRAEAGVRPGQLLEITDYLKPRAEEIAAVMPASLGRWMMRRSRLARWMPLLGRGLRVRSNGLLGYRALRLVAALRHLRRRSLRFEEEQLAIEAWLGAMRTALRLSTEFAAALAGLPRVLKGYSDTQARGLAAYRRITDEVVGPALAEGADAAAVARLRRALAAALADEDHRALDAELAPADASLPEAT